MRFLRAILFAAFALPLPGRAEAPAFAEAGVSFLERHCVSCHGERKQKANLTLHAVRDELALLRAGKQWKEVLKLVESGDMPPEEAKTEPTAEERQRFLAASRAVFATAARAKPDPGKLTLRRLNRAEYNATIRDLLKVDFRPADDFPSDDVGYGFDNIADVMSVSPVLMERYLDAAEGVAALAIPNNPARPAKRTMAGKFCEPASATVPQDQFRPINAGQKDAILSGPLNTPSRIVPDGEYIVRARLYAQSAGAVKVALIAAGAGQSGGEFAALDGAALQAVTPGRILRAFDITARSAAQAQTIEVKLSPKAAIERIALAAFKPAAGPPPTLFVEWLEYEGPLDARSAPEKAIMAFAPDKPPNEQAREIIWRFASRAWRRPLQPEEIERLARIVDHAVGHSETWEEGLRRAITAVLASPRFVFRLEPDAQPENPEAHAITDFQLASRLSYFLWSSCPDEELLQLAYEKKLSGQLDAQVGRMLRDPRASALVENFALQWLQLGRLAGHSADAKTFSKWKPELRAAMLEETRRFCADIFQGDRSVLELLDADFTWVDRQLAELYGLKVSGGMKDGEWQRVSLAGTPRGGLLTQASVLTVTSNPTRTSPVKRGKWVLEQLLASPPPPAPPDVPSLDDAQRKGLTGTFRQKLEQHRADPQCANCHVKMDAFGLALENFDGIGQWRERDETGGPVDATTKLPRGRKLEGAAGLKSLLREQRDDFTRCLTEKLLIYALGRGLDYYDEPAIERIQGALAKDGYRFSSLVTEIAKSTPFRLRRGALQTSAVSGAGAATEPRLESASRRAD